MGSVAKKKPFSFYMCSLTFTFERASYYAAKWLIVIYLTTALVKGGLDIDKGTAGIYQSYLVAFTYLAPIVGGFIADRYIGARYLVPLGLLIMSCGYAVGGFYKGLTGVTLMIILVVIGTGFFKSNLSALTGTLFKDYPAEQKDDAFSTQYSFVNVGSFIGTTAVGVLYITLGTGSELGFLACFRLAAVMCFLGAVWFVFGWRFLGDAGKQPFAKEKELVSEVKVEEKEDLKPYEIRRILSIIMISAFSVIFWVFWYLTYLAVYDYAPKYVDLNIGGYEVPTAYFDSENALLCIILGPILGALWIRLAKRPKGDMSLYKKLSLGLLLLGASFLMLVGSELQRGVGAGEDSKSSIWWIIMFGVLLSVGEMVFSPLGNAFITKYAPKRILSVMMAVWTVATFLAGISYGYVYNWTLSMNQFYVYIGIASILAILAIILILFDKQLSSLVEIRPGEEEEER